MAVCLIYVLYLVVIRTWACKGWAKASGGLVGCWDFGAGWFCVYRREQV